MGFRAPEVLWLAYFYVSNISMTPCCGRSPGGIFENTDTAARRGRATQHASSALLNFDSCGHFVFQKMLDNETSSETDRPLGHLPMPDLFMGSASARRSIEENLQRSSPIVGSAPCTSSTSPLAAMVHAQTSPITGSMTFRVQARGAMFSSPLANFLEHGCSPPMRRRPLLGDRMRLREFGEHLTTPCAGADSPLAQRNANWSHGVVESPPARRAESVDSGSPTSFGRSAKSSRSPLQMCFFSPMAGSSPVANRVGSCDGGCWSPVRSVNQPANSELSPTDRAGAGMPSPQRLQRACARQEAFPSPFHRFKNCSPKRRTTPASLTVDEVEAQGFHRRMSSAPDA